MDLRTLCDRLRGAANEFDGPAAANWPEQQMQWLAEAGVFAWFVPEEYGGSSLNDVEQLEGYLALSESCLTTAFILTQWNAACKRIGLSGNGPLKARWLPGMAAGRTFATVGISHLTTSRQHVGKPALEAHRSEGGSYRLSGMSPWVTAASHADVLVTGATLSDGQQILCTVPSDRDGLTAGPGANLMALSASCTDAVRFSNVLVHEDELIAGPMPNVMQAGSGGGAGGLQTSTLAIGLAQAAVRYLQAEAESRSDLSMVANKLAADVGLLRAGLMRLAKAEQSDSELNPGRLREQANSLVLRASQAALAAAKGAGFMASHPCGRWCREALFFLVWSCPQPVMAANLCEFAQL